LDWTCGNAYIYAGGSTPAEQVSLTSGTVSYLNTDALGSVRGVISSSGSLTATTSYDAWGNPQTTGGLTASTPFGYAGAYTDPDGLLYLINRYYDPATGQFTSVDSDVGQTLAPYGYATGNPVKAVILEHDNDLYDLTVKLHGKTAVIQTTSHHRFWDQTTRQWTYADTLGTGDLLRTPGHAKVSVISGYDPAEATGWMWDLTVANDHDFYINVATTAVLVHNCTSPNQMQRQIDKGQAPRGVDRVCTQCSYSDDNLQPHIHFDNVRPTLNMDGTWGTADRPAFLIRSSSGF
jgi:RHS repeat-associated protein